MFPHQEEASVYLDKCMHFALLMQMRLGKTLTVIRWAKRRRPLMKRLLLVAPLTVLKTWEDELKEEGENFITAYGLTKQKREAVFSALWDQTPTRRTWVLINYESLLALGQVQTKMHYGKSRRIRKIPDIAYYPWDFVGLDESTKIANPQAQISKILTDGFRYSHHRGILTGLISPESELQIFNQMKFVFGSFMGYRNYWKFRDDLFYLRWDGKWVPQAGVRSQIKKELHRLCFIKTRKQANMGNEVVQSTRYVEMTPQQKKIYKQVEKEYAYAVLAEDGEKSEEERQTSYVITRDLWLRKLSGGFDPDNNCLSEKKIEEIISLLQGDLVGEKVVIWCAFRHEVTHVAEFLKRKGIHSEILLGGTKLGERRRALNSFKTQKEVSCLIATESSAKFGIDCSHASTCIYYSNEYSCEARNQSQDRIVHPSKTNIPLAIDLVTCGTRDEDVIQALRNKTFSAKFMMQKMKERMNRV
jgi:SNF2 family DNA or RNA helicase